MTVSDLQPSVSQAALNAKIMLGGMGAPGGGGGGMGMGRPRKGGVGAAYGAAADAPAAAQHAQSSPALASAEVSARACSGRTLAELRRLALPGRRETSLRVGPRLASAARR